MKRILCFGDSNTYGYVPGGGGRFDENTRWTSLLQRKLGDGYLVIEEGLCGRTTIFEDEFRKGRKGLEFVGPIVETHNPIDVLIVMLGTNDAKSHFQSSPEMITKGVEQVIEKARSMAAVEMKILLVSPIHLGEGVGEEGFDPAYDKNSELVIWGLAKEYEKLAKDRNYSFLDAALIAKPSEIDREHLDEEGHKKLANALYQKLKEEEQVN